MDRFEVGFNVDVNDEWPPVGVEFLWLAISSNGYQVLTAPFFLKDLSVGDILTIDLEQKGGQRFALGGNGVRSKLLRYPTYHALAHPLRSRGFLVASNFIAARESQSWGCGGFLRLVSGSFHGQPERDPSSSIDRP
jgi:hypothetical protein